MFLTSDNREWYGNIFDRVVIKVPTDTGCEEVWLSKEDLEEMLEALVEDDKEE